ncbi:alkaline ceramidase 3-like isoform X2 [Tubulanus polymorphus]|uniref:alkaline ceramidase 3-like isoform X2 n=1 Tax=Tubulanus polymorphus TaxID=672921 RepID=UPI003DA586DD
MEPGNTISNLFYILPSLIAISLAIRDKLETRFLACYLTMLLVGIGSWMFHMTLRYSSQLADEIPMLVLVSIFIYAMATTSSSRKEVNLVVLLGLLLSVSASAIVYMIIREPLIFQITFGVLAMLLIVMGRILFNQKHMQNIDKTLFYKAFILMLVAFCLWIIDTAACSKLRTLRTHIFPAVRPITQLHTCWHILSSYAGFTTIAFLVYARASHLGNKHHILSIMGFPFVRCQQNSNVQNY